MDLYLRYRGSTTNTVTTGFYNSQFLGKATSEDTLKKFKQCVSKIDQDKFLQVTMDGPNNEHFFSFDDKKRMKRGETF